MSGDPRSIGVFDSGIGGLTVVRELRRRLPRENLVYFGDTARVPYGSKSTETVTRFARECCEVLLRFDPKLIVIACNTASAAALNELDATLPVPVRGVVAPGAKEAVLKSQGHTIAVIATESTIHSDAYRRAMQGYDKNVRVVQRPCPLFVPMVEEGRTSDDPIVQAVAREYLAPLINLDPRVLVLGCTHYPLIKEAIGRVMGGSTLLVDSGEQTARMVADLLKQRGELSESETPGTLSCYVSDNPQRFHTLGQRFLDEPIRDVVWCSPEHQAIPALR